MSTPPVSAATLQVDETGAACRLVVGGRWDLAAPRPEWRPAESAGFRQVIVTAGELGRWDGALVLFLGEVRRTCEAHGWPVEAKGLPAGIPASVLTPVPTPASERPALPMQWLTAVGQATRDLVAERLDFSRFIGHCTIGFGQLVRQPRRFRWRDCVTQMQLCGVHGMPIVWLISFLVGVIMAYQSAVLLRQFGADIWVADLIGLSVVREMGPLMAAIVLAGRTGAAFAAELANMNANEEIDALSTLGLNPVHFLVLPRLLALQLMLPLLVLYACALGIAGGMLIAWALLDIPPVVYWTETKSIVDLSDLATGLIKSVAFGGLIGLAGCLRGLEAERSAAGVGRAATSAVVTSLLFIIIADAVFAVLFHILGL